MFGSKYDNVRAGVGGGLDLYSLTQFIQVCM